QLDQVPTPGMLITLDTLDTLDTLARLAYLACFWPRRPGLCTFVGGVAPVRRPGICSVAAMVDRFAGGEVVRVRLIRSALALMLGATLVLAGAGPVGAVRLVAPGPSGSGVAPATRPEADAPLIATGTAATYVGVGGPIADAVNLGSGPHALAVT